MKIPYKNDDIKNDILGVKYKRPQSQQYDYVWAKEVITGIHRGLEYITE